MMNFYPKGVTHQRPGLRVSALPWDDAELNINPNGVEQNRLFFNHNRHNRMHNGHNLFLAPIVSIVKPIVSIVVKMCNPVGVDGFIARPPRVARIRATLVFDIKPPWGFGTGLLTTFLPPC